MNRINDPLAFPASLAPADAKSVVDKDSSTTAADVAVAVVHERSVLHFGHVARLEIRQADVTARSLPDWRGGSRGEDLAHALAGARQVEERVRARWRATAGRNNQPGRLWKRKARVLTLDEEVHRDLLEALELAGAPFSLANRGRLRSLPLVRARRPALMKFKRSARPPGCSIVGWTYLVLLDPPSRSYRAHACRALLRPDGDENWSPMKRRVRAVRAPRTRSRRSSLALACFDLRQTCSNCEKPRRMSG